ncbi:adenosylcobinamide-GDP ribazoletransferase [Methanosphaera sp. WGK6]|uniref:adenosylcobinamide-GDP ribazoletransferase n=1 Tax=Methanosphaera sp. WGK6 TaxID=1561964 RepID=UPI00084C7796|nr:adenosylcobinamide-GDP ribazoletransferase [Methanosphaera sp. WGK6]OED30441.1 hypothetical protein NL43_02105 [Methanosphaera sp. WGK6]
MSTEKNNFNRKAKVNPSLNGFLGLVSFSTRIPIKRYITIEEMASSVIIWPYIGLGIGIIAAIIVFILNNILGFTSILTATLIYCFLIWFTGFNHVDGVMDMGDGLMAHGEPEKRLNIMRDSMVGTGGIATFFIVATITIAALSSISLNYIIPSVILMELCAKLSMVTSMVFGKSDKKGIGAEIKKGMDYKVLVFTIIISLIIGYFLLKITGIFAVFASVISGLYLSSIADKKFGCVTGDILGASNEIARVVCLVFIILNLNLMLL